MVDSRPSMLLEPQRPNSYFLLIKVGVLSTHFRPIVLRPMTSSIRTKIRQTFGFFRSLDSHRFRRQLTEIFSNEATKSQLCSASNFLSDQSTSNQSKSIRTEVPIQLKSVKELFDEIENRKKFYDFRWKSSTPVSGKCCQRKKLLRS